MKRKQTYTLDASDRVSWTFLLDANWERLRTNLKIETHQALKNWNSNNALLANELHKKWTLAF